MSIPITADYYLLIESTGHRLYEQEESLEKNLGGNAALADLCVGLL